MIREIKDNEIRSCVSVIRQSFKTVADEFGFTVENAPRFTAFATTDEKLFSQYDEEQRPMYAFYSDGGRMVGYYSLFRLENGECELNNLCVLPEYRHRNIGEKLLAPRNHGEHPREITIECNPDDMSASYAQALASIGFNRVSMGVQTFDDERLRFLHRRHDAHQAAAAMQQLHAAGIDNISLDLIFGFPGQRLEQWEADIERALELRPTHLSAYGLSYEEGTPLERQLRDGTISAIDEEESIRMYDALCDQLQDAGYEHYELSNFALPGYRSLHNSGYWQGVHYLGLGAAAHSYDGVSRQWNVGDLSKYIDSIAHDMIPMEREVLDQDTRWDDLMVTALRTCEGIDLSMVREEYGIDYLRYLLDAAQLSLSQDLLKIEDDHLRLTRRGIPVSDMVMADFMRSIGD